MNAYHEKDIVVVTFVDMALVPSMVERIRVHSMIVVPVVVVILTQFRGNKIFAMSVLSIMVPPSKFQYKGPGLLQATDMA